MEDGFSLVELVMVIVLLGILGSMGAEFISLSFKGFSDTQARAEIYEEGKIALTRMEKELRNAVPNALKKTTNPYDELQFGMVDEAAMGDNALFGQYRETAADFPTATLTDINTNATPQTNWILSVYNRKWTNDFDNGGRLFKVTGTSPPAMTMGGSISQSSPEQRYYVVNKAIRYSLFNTTLYRDELPVDENGLVGAFIDGNGYPLARDVTALDIYYAAGSLNRNAMVSISFTMLKNGQKVDFHKEVSIRNAP